MLRLSEIYPAVQGEGPHVGSKTVFVRFAGCNLRCPLWPCDSQYAIDTAKYRHEWQRRDVAAVAMEIIHQTDYNNISNISLTGGEPFLQKNSELFELLKFLRGAGERNYTFDIFSNGTLEYPNWVMQDDIHFIMDWKLPGSGEDPYDPTRIKNLATIKNNGSVKFVCANEEDFHVAKLLYERYVEHLDMPVFYGVAWNKMENKDLVNLVMEHNLPWRLNVQVHNYVFDRNQRGI